jgi:hypothetical protein
MHNADLDAPGPVSPAWLRGLGLAAVLSAVGLAVALSIRRIDSPDVGYHLSCGEHFLATGEIVSSNRWYYTELDPEALSDPSTWGPASWYDPAARTYRFVNLNWLSQVLMALAARGGGMTALSIFQVVLIAALCVPLLVIGRRNGAPWAALAAALVLVALTMSPRIPIRPETFGYLALAVQWCLLAGPGFGPRRAVAVALLQVFAANVHSYFLLGAGLTAAMLLEAWLDSRRSTSAEDAEAVGALRRRAQWLGAALAGVLVAPFANPWLARGAWMPIETLLYMRRHGIGSAGVPAGQMMHPWAAIRELRPTFDRGLGALLDEPPNAAFVICLVVAALAALETARRRRWGWLLAIVAMTSASLQMIRNTAVFAIVVMPVAAALLAGAYRELRARRGGARDVVPAFLAAATIAAAVYFTAAVVTNRFYVPRSGTARFGLGPSRVVLPLSATEWINEHSPPDRVWCDYDTSSNLLYFTRPHREVPVTTGTWTFPPQTMVEGLLLELDRAPFAAFADEYGVNTVVFSTVWKGPTPLWAKLLGDPRWALVDVGMSHLILVRRGGAADDFASAHELRAGTFDVASFLKRVEADDPVPGLGAARGAEMLLYLGWYDPALDVCEDAIRRDGRNARAWAVKARAQCDLAIRRAQEAQALAEAGSADEAARRRAEAEGLRRDAERSANRALGLDPSAPWAPGVLQQTVQLRGLLGEGA